MHVWKLSLSILLLATLTGARPVTASLGLTYRDVGISLGNAPRVIGLRINGVDADVRRVDGLNLTLWNPRPSPRASFNGAALGLIGPKAGRLQGLAIGGLGATASIRIRGLVVAGFGVGTRRLQGIALGGLLTKVGDGSQGVALSLISCQGQGELRGLAFGGAFAAVDSTRGFLVGGLGAVGGRIDGVGLSPGVVGCERDLRGLGLGGLVVFAGESLTGLAISAGIVGARKELRGIALGGLGVGAGERMQGLALGGLVAMAPETRGISFGLLNGVVIDDINLEDFLRIRTVNRRATGLSLGLFNYSAELRGLQIGLFNYAANNPPWARLLPGMNLHF